MDGTLEISNSFPLPHHFNEDDDKSAKGVGEFFISLAPITRLICCSSALVLAKYQASMLRSLKEVQVDDSIVGFYQATTLGSFFNQSLVETQAIHQDRLRHGGIVVVHGKSFALRLLCYRMLILCPDISQTARGNASFRAFRLTKAFLDAYKRNNFSTDRYVVTISETKETFGLIFRSRSCIV